MTICIPVTQDLGMASPLSPHFGSAPLFVLVDVGSDSLRTIPNRNRHHEHGKCSPLAALAGETLGGIVVGGIGAGALSKLQAAGIRVFRSAHATVGETLAAYRAGEIDTVTLEMACAHGGHP